MTGGRRRADERTAAARAEETGGELGTDVHLRRSTVAAGPESDDSPTQPRTSRADRRREGLLPPGEDPLIRRPPVRPAGGPPPGGGRRRTDLDPTAAPGRPPATGERRRSATPFPGPAAQTPAAPPPVPQRPTPVVPVPVVRAPVVRAPERPAPGPVPSGPMTSAAPAIPALGRPAAAPLDADVLPARGGEVGAPASRWDDAAPCTTGMPSWAAEPGPPAPPHSTPAPSGSAWTAEGATTAAPPAGRAVMPRRPAPAAERRAPEPAPERRAPAPAAERRAPEPAPERRAPEPAAERPAPEPAPEPVRKAAEVPVGGRAAARLERQAAEAARKKSGRRSAAPARPENSPQRGPGRDGDSADRPRRASRGVVQGLVAVVLVAVAVLGFWSFTSPGTREASVQTPATSSAPAADPAEPPAADPTEPPAVESVPASDEETATPVGEVRAPITVLNSTSINGLAADIGDQFSGAGWSVSSTGPSPVTDVATTTVYFTEGDTTQQQAAAQLIERFPDVSGPVPRYFEVPDQPTPGLVVVVTGNWRP